MKETFKQLITNFHKSAIPKPSFRDIDIPKLPKNIRKVFVFIGMRRSGKTWTLYQHIHNLIKQGIKKEQIIYLNFEDDRLNDLKAEDLKLILDAYFELYPEHMHEENLHFFFDEIHVAPGWQKFIRRLLDTEKMTIYISGSSAKMLSKEIATNLRGRTLTREIFPLSFKEYLYYYNINFNTKLSSKEQALIYNYCNKYILKGGFPESIELSDSLRRELLQEYLDVVIYRDIIERYDIKNTHLVKSFLLYCIKNAASMLSINKIYNFFKSCGYSISKDSLYAFMEYFEDAFCLFKIPLYTFSIKKQGLMPKKIYPIDSGLITALSVKNDFDHAARLETTVLAHLKRQKHEIYYYNTNDNKKIDFLTIDPKENINLFQVTLSLSDPKTREREVESLKQSISELNLTKGTIITIDQEETIQITKEKKIKVIPIWKWLLY